MAGTLSINGQSITVTGYGNTATIPWSGNSFTIGWSGWPTGSTGQIMLQFYDEEYDSCFSFSGNTGVSPCFEFVLDLTGDSSSWASYYGYCHIGSSGSLTVNSTKNFVGKSIAVFYNNSRDGEDGSCTISFVSPSPSITQQPELTSPSAGAAGTSVVMTWTAAQMQNQGSAVLHYQVFVGPSSTYSDSYHIATTTALTHTLTEAEIISKCGNLFGSGTGRGTCYLFVRAYWEIDGTPMAEGWTTPTGQAFIYLPTVNPPQNVSLTPARGKAFTITWTTATMGNGDVATQTHLMRKMDGSESYEAIAQNLSGNSYTFNVPSTWTKNKTYLIALVNIYYIRGALSASVTFTYSPENTVRLGSVDYVIMKCINNTWVAMDPYKYVSGEWKLCSTT